MSRNATLVGLALLLGLALALSLRWKSARDTRARVNRSAAIRSVVDTARERGWVETFETPRSQPLADYDPRWRMIFGRMLVDRRLGAAIGDPDGGWELDGGDDYAFRAADVPNGSVQIVMDGWWDGIGSIATQGAVQSEPPHRLYEAALWRGKLALVYFIGPGPDKFEILAESPPLPVQRGFYRLLLCLIRGGSGWNLRAALQDPSRGYVVLGQVSATDGRLGGGGQGIGILGGGGSKSSYITGIAVRDLSNEPTDGASPPLTATSCL